MTKHFFITIPYFNQSVQNVAPSSLLSLANAGANSPKNMEASFESARIQLEQRILTVTQGLSRFGLRAQRLGTEEVVELFYKLFNPGEGDHSAPKVN
jgi:hypothetical protein